MELTLAPGTATASPRVLDCDRPLTLHRTSLGTGERSTVLVRCRRRQCSGCGDEWRGDADRILREAMAVIAARGRGMMLVTLTAPSFGPTHTPTHRGPQRRPCPTCTRTAREAAKAAGKPSRSAKSVYHPEGDPLRGLPVDPDSYDYAAAVAWNAAASTLWARTRDEWARAAGEPLPWAGVWELQIRGALHLHVLMPATLDADRLRRLAAGVSAALPGGGVARWGEQLDIRRIGTGMSSSHARHYLLKAVSGYLGKSLDPSARTAAEAAGPPEEHRRRLRDETWRACPRTTWGPDGPEPCPGRGRGCRSQRHRHPVGATGHVLVRARRALPDVPSMAALRRDRQRWARRGQPPPPPAVWRLAPVEEREAWTAAVAGFRAWLAELAEAPPLAA